MHHGFLSIALKGLFVVEAATQQLFLGGFVLSLRVPGPAANDVLHIEAVAGKSVGEQRLPEQLSGRANQLLPLLVLRSPGIARPQHRPPPTDVLEALDLVDAWDLVHGTGGATQDFALIGYVAKEIALKVGHQNKGRFRECLLCFCERSTEFQKLALAMWRATTASPGASF